MTPCDTLVFFDISFLETTWLLISEFKIYRLDAGILRWKFTHNDNKQRNLIAVGAIGEISSFKEKADQDWTKVVVYRKLLYEGRERSFVYCQGIFILIYRHFHQLWGKMDALERWFNKIHV